MFSEKDLLAYRSIQAPAALREKVMAAKSVRRQSHLLRTGMIAAGLLLFCAAGLFWRGGAPVVALHGETLTGQIVFQEAAPFAVMARRSNVRIVPVELTVSQKTDISVSHGCMTVDGSAPTQTLTSSEPITLQWEILQEEVMPACEMEIRDQNGATIVTLTFDEAGMTATKRRIST